MNRSYVRRYVRNYAEELGHLTYRNPPRGHAFWRCELTGRSLPDVGTPRDVNNFYNDFNRRARALALLRQSLEYLEST